ncbi:hypothetical protein HYQ26_gp037 [Salmonella phage Se-G]|uniref:hypothetical protein n=1 Tax=Salmonella phage Se-G TaxID=2698907 RepID=UPI0018AFE7C2|nr:hypothetical protein HYQ26_gp037 [Salmonella phage Se-G]
MFQTLLLVPGQPGIILEHNSKNEAENVLRNVKAANAYHNGGSVTAIPLNYTDKNSKSFYFLLDVGVLSSDEKIKFMGEIADFLKTRSAEFTQLKG